MGQAGKAAGQVFSWRLGTAQKKTKKKQDYYVYTGVLEFLPTPPVCKYIR